MNLARFPRRRYTEGWTPLEHLPHLTQYMGGPHIFIKRDDLLGLAGGGNKTRKLEFLVADALRQGADTLITVGAVQSNHCRLTLGAAVKEGMRCRLVIEQRVPDSYDYDATGNNFLFRLLGVEKTTVVDLGTDLGAAMQAEADELEGEGRKGYVIPGGGSNPLGALGYVSCAQEILAQAFDKRLQFEHLVCASGSGGTHSGLLVGLGAMSSEIQVTGISVRRPVAEQEELIGGLVTETRKFLGLPSELSQGELKIFDDYVGPGYSLPTEEMAEAVRIFARTEGILLDPVYTGKAAAGLLDLIQKGHFQQSEKVLFLHTGGSPGLYAYQDVILD
ncbi:MAG: D-cysteine desulfhydrase [Gemmatimonadales bacterium]